MLRWHLQLGNVVIPKSVTPARISENIDIFDFELDDDEMAAFARLDTGERTGPDPATFVSALGQSGPFRDPPPQGGGRSGGFRRIPSSPPRSAPRSVR